MEAKILAQPLDHGIEIGLRANRKLFRAISRLGEKRCAVARRLRSEFREARFRIVSGYADHQGGRL
jgi:hypothetical protein